MRYCFLILLITTHTITESHDLTLTCPLTIFPQKKMIVIRKKISQSEEKICGIFENAFINSNEEDLLISKFAPFLISPFQDESGFFFLDNGMLYIKKNIKRSPRLLEPSEPIYDIRSVQWKSTDEPCYLSAKKGYSRGIFSLDYEGVVTTLLHSEGINYFFPHVFSNNLFYIERKHDYVMKQKQLNDLASEENTLLCFEKGSCVEYLWMDTETSGWTIERSNSVPLTNIIFCDYCHFFKEPEGNWIKKRLFSFSVPAELITSENEFDSEMITLFLPCHGNIHNKIIIFFVNYTPEEMSLLCYEENGSIKKIASDHILVAPHIFNDKLVYGGETCIFMKLDEIVY